MVDKLEVTVFAIAPDETVDTDQFIAQTIQAAIVDTARKGQVPYFAGLAKEMHAAVFDGDEVNENRIRRMKADRQLHEHPKVIEVTRLYAACRDGRRWSGEHILTGEHAGAKTGPVMRAGARVPDEGDVHKRLIRAVVGLS